MKCPMCGGKVEKGVTNFPGELENGIVFIKGIPASICSQCGEVFLDDKVTTWVEEAVKKAKKEGIEFEVIRYQAA